MREMLLLILGTIFAQSVQPLMYVVEVQNVAQSLQLEHSIISGKLTCLGSKSADVGVRRRYNSDIFVGLALQLPDSNTQARECLQHADGVLNLWSTTSYRPTFLEHGMAEPGSQLEPYHAKSPRSILLPETSRRPEGSIGDSFSQTTFNTTEVGDSLHRLTGVQHLHQRGINGTGVRIAVIDAGVDYYHRALGGGFGEGYTVSGGLDLTGDDFDGVMHGPLRGPYPYSECMYHGTHVTSIIAGNDPLTGFVGVAPGAKIEHFRIVGCQKVGFDTETVIDAVLEAKAREVDVIVASVAMNTGSWPDEAVSEILSRVAAQDRILCVAAVGNYGWKGVFSSVSPAGAIGVTTVGVVNQPQFVLSRPRATYKLIDPNRPEESFQTISFPWSIGGPSHFPSEAALISAKSLGCAAGHCFDNVSPEALACKPIRTDYGQGILKRILRDSVVLVQRGGCTYAAKMENLRALGARFVLIHDDANAEATTETDEAVKSALLGLPEITNTYTGIEGVGFIPGDIGRILVGAMRAGSKVTVAMDTNFTSAPYMTMVENDQPAALVNGRGSWGPSPLGEIIPSLVAPGGGIWAPMPRSWGGYQVLNGSSMAAPYIAGVAALLRQVYPHIGAQALLSRLKATATPLGFSDGDKGNGIDYDFLAPAWQQGNGLVDAVAAIEATSSVEPASLVFNDGDHLPNKKYFTLSNNGAYAKRYELYEEAAVTVMSFPENSTSFVPWADVPHIAKAGPEFLANLAPELKVQIDIRPKSVTLEPKESINITITADWGPLKPHVQSRCPLYSGFIRVLQHEVDDMDHEALEEHQGRGSSTQDHPVPGSRFNVAYGAIGCALRDIPNFPPGWNQTFVTPAAYQRTEGEQWEAQASEENRFFLLPSHPDSQMNPPHDQIFTDGFTLAEKVDTSMLWPTLNIDLNFMAHSVLVYAISAESEDGERLQDLNVGNQEIQIPEHHSDLQVFPGFLTAEKPGGFARVRIEKLPWNGRYTNGTRATPGKYRFKVCARKDSERPGDEFLSTADECMLTNAFTIGYSPVPGLIAQDDGKRPWSFFFLYSFSFFLVSSLTWSLFAMTRAI